jgi:hypothetical protein
MAEMLRGNFYVQAVFVAARLGIADLLAAAPAHEMSAADLAAASGMDVDALHRMMRALASKGIFDERGGGRFRLNELGETLRSDHPESLRPAALIAGDAQYKVWSLFKDGVKFGAAGMTGFERIFRQPLFAFLEEHPDIYAVFNAAMTSRVAPLRARLADVCDVRDGDVIVDVGGGVGSVVGELLARHPRAAGVLLDTQCVIDEAYRRAWPQGTRERLTLVPGDFLREVPRGDVMILITVLHMFQDERALAILRNCRGSLNPGGRLYVGETLLRGPNDDDPGKWQDLNMMLMTGGRERTFEEYAGLLRQARFADIARTEDFIVATA